MKKLDCKTDPEHRDLPTNISDETKDGQTEEYVSKIKKV
jgi:hypothetical protein